MANQTVESLVDDDVPSTLKHLAIEFCTEFDIKGLSDPMYVANVAAYELGMGDGCSQFNDNDPDLSKVGIVRDRLSLAYRTCIKKSESICSVNNVLRESLSA